MLLMLVAAVLLPHDILNRRSSSLVTIGLGVRFGHTCGLGFLSDLRLLGIQRNGFPTQSLELRVTPRLRLCVAVDLRLHLIDGWHCFVACRSEVHDEQPIAL